MNTREVRYYALNTVVCVIGAALVYVLCVELSCLREQLSQASRRGRATGNAQELFVAITGDSRFRRVEVGAHFGIPVINDDNFWGSSETYKTLAQKSSTNPVIMIVEWRQVSCSSGDVIIVVKRDNVVVERLNGYVLADLGSMEDFCAIRLRGGVECVGRKLYGRELIGFLKDDRTREDGVGNAY